jgi:hypothetical protein
MNVPARADYFAGWIDTTIHDFLLKVQEPSSSMAYALITCLDSSVDLPALVRTSSPLRELEGRSEIVGQGLLLKTRHLLNAVRQNRIFYGYDEIWFFPHSKISPKPAGVFLVGPHRLPNELPETLVNWMKETRCALGLGDGTGMNFCARIRGLARHLLQASSDAASASLQTSRESA